MEQTGRESVSVDRKATAGRQPFLMEVSVAASVFVFDGNLLRVLAVRSGDNSSEWRLPRYAFESGLGLQEAAALAVRKFVRIAPDRFYQAGAISLPPEGEGRAAVEVGLFAATVMIDNETSENIASDGSSNSGQAKVSAVAAKSPDSSADHMWLSIDELQAFDAASRHQVENAIFELRRRARFENVVFSLLPEEFSLSELQRAFEVVIARKIDVRNFRKKMEAMQILEELPYKPKGMAHRPPRLFSYSQARFEERLKRDSEVRFF